MLIFIILLKCITYNELVIILDNEDIVFTQLLICKYNWYA